MSKTQAETVIKNIIREIVQECTTRGQIVSETLVAFTVIKFHFDYVNLSKMWWKCFYNDKVKAIVLDPDNQFHVDRQLTKDDVQKLIKVF